MNKRILLLAVGTFAIGMEGFMIAGILPTLAQAFGVSLAVAGQLVTIFSLVYAFGSPVLTTLTGRWDKRTSLVVSILLFAAGNAIGGLASSYALLVIGRVVAAIGAGWFAPAASASAAALVPAEKRGRALSVVISGQTVALMLGVPLGTLIAFATNWRLTFGIVALAALIASVLIRRWLPSIPSSGSVTLRERLSFLRRPDLMAALLTTLTWAAGIFSVYTYIADVFANYGAAERTISLVLFITGIASFAGVHIGGRSADRFGPNRTIAYALSFLTVSLALLSVIGGIPGLSANAAVALGIAALALWGASGYAFNPAQQLRLIGLSGPSAGVVLSLQSSALYLGSALGASTGGLLVHYGSVGGLGYMSGGWTLLALILFGISLRLAARAGRAVERRRLSGEEAEANLP